MLWFLLRNGINIVSDNNERYGGSHCIETGQAHVDNIDGYSFVCQPGGKQTDTVVLSYCSGVHKTSQNELNTINTKKLIESNITCSLAAVYTTNAPITSVQLPITSAGNFKYILLLRNSIIVLQFFTV